MAGFEAADMSYGIAAPSAAVTGLANSTMCVVQKQRIRGVGAVTAPCISCSKRRLSHSLVGDKDAPACTAVRYRIALLTVTI